jgi:phosphate/sulfate permease
MSAAALASTEGALLLGSALFALTMGGSGMAPAFGVTLGAKLIDRRLALLLFGGFVVLGALLLGGFVARTLGAALVPPGTLDPRTVLCVIASATLALGLANVLRIPQSTSWVTVAAIVTVGLVHGNLDTDTITRRLLPVWIGLPVLAFVLAFLACRAFYPLRGWNLGVHASLARHAWKLRALSLVTSCYVALAIGANNVANVVGPLAAAQVVDVTLGFLLLAPLFGVGALVFPSPARTVGTDLVPLGVLTASLCNLVVGTLLVVASLCGIPQSLVQMNAATVAAVALVKEGDVRLMRTALLQRIGVLWLVTPALAAALTWALLEVLHG